MMLPVVLNKTIAQLRFLRKTTNKKNKKYNTFSRCSFVGINGKIDPLSEYDEVDGITGRFSSLFHPTAVTLLHAP